MSAMRNIVVHEYFGVSNKILWETNEGKIECIKSGRDAIWEKKG